MKFLLALLFTHFIGDVFIRTDFIDRYKSNNVYVLLFHCFIWACTVSLALEYFNQFTFAKFFFLLLGHTFIDFVKGSIDPNPYWTKNNRPDVSKYKVLDQLAHIGQLVIVWRWELWIT